VCCGLIVISNELVTNEAKVISLNLFFFLLCGYMILKKKNLKLKKKKKKEKKKSNELVFYVTNKVTKRDDIRS
jgi:hypothetical protein